MCHLPLPFSCTKHAHILDQSILNSLQEKFCNIYPNHKGMIYLVGTAVTECITNLIDLSSNQLGVKSVLHLLVIFQKLLE